MGREAMGEDIRVATLPITGGCTVKASCSMLNLRLTDRVAEIMAVPGRR